MKYVIQFLIIAAVSFAGELMGLLIPLPVPASVYGLLLMLVCLLTGVIKLHQVEKVGDFLVKIMPLLFVGPCVSLRSAADLLSGNLAGLFIISLVSTVAVMAVTGWVAQLILRRQESKESKTGGAEHE